MPGNSGKLDGNCFSILGDIEATKVAKVAKRTKNFILASKGWMIICWIFLLFIRITFLAQMLILASKCLMHSRQEKPFSNIYWIRTTFGIFTKSFYRCVFYSFFLKSQNSAYLEKLISHFSLKFFYVRGVKLRGISYLFLQILRVPLRKFSKGFLPFVMQKSYKIEWYFVL